MSFPKKSQYGGVPVAESSPKSKYGGVAVIEEEPIQKKNPAENDLGNGGQSISPSTSQSSSILEGASNPFTNPLFFMQPASKVVAKVGDKDVNLATTAPSYIVDKDKYAANLKQKIDTKIPLTQDELFHVKKATGFDDELAALALSGDNNFFAVKTVKQRDNDKKTIVDYMASQDESARNLNAAGFYGLYENYDLEDPANVAKIFDKIQAEKKKLEVAAAETNAFDEGARALSASAKENLLPNSPFIQAYNKLKDWKAKQIAENFVKKGVTDVKEVGFAIQNGTDTEKTEQYWKSHSPVIPTGQAAVDAARQLFKKDTPLQDYELENTGANYLKEALQYEAARKALAGEDNKDDIANYAAVSQKQNELYQKYPDVRYGQIVAAISNAKASEQGLTTDTESNGIVSRLGYTTSGDDAIRLAKDLGLYNTPLDKELVDKIAGQQEINPLLAMFIPGAAAIKKVSAPIENVSFAGQFVEGAKGVLENTGKSIVDIAQLRGNGTISAEKYNDDVINSWKKDQSNLDTTQKNIALVGNTTGQIVGQGLTTLAFSGVGKAAQLSQNAIENLGFWASGALSSYDDAKKSMLEITNSDAKAEAGALLIGFFNAASEKIFKDTKVFGDVFGKRVGNILNSIDEDELYTEATRNTVLKALQSDLPKWAANYVVESNKDGFEEFSTAVLQDVTEAVLGDNQQFDLSKTWGNARDTYVSTLIGGSLAAGKAAYTDVRINPNAATSLYHASENPNFYISSIKELQNKNQISEAEGNKKIQIINTAAKVNAELSALDGNLNDRQKSAYISYRTTQAQLQEMAANTTDNSLKLQLEEKIKVLDEQKDKILNGLQFNEKLQPLNNLYDKEQSVRDAELKVSENASPENLAALETAKSDFSKSIIDYYTPATPKADNLLSKEAAISELNKNRNEDNINIDTQINSLDKNDATYNNTVRELEIQRKAVNDYYDGIENNLSDENPPINKPAFPVLKNNKNENIKAGQVAKNESAQSQNTETTAAQVEDTQVEQKGLVEAATKLLPANNPALQGTPEQQVRFIAEQAQNVSPTGEKLSGDAYLSTVDKFGDKLVTAAIEAYPLESLVATPAVKEPSTVTGKDVYKSAEKAGSEHNDALPEYKEQIESTDYKMDDISIDELLRNDPDLKAFVDEQKGNKEFSKKRKVEQPIIIGSDNKGSGNKSGVVIDGSNRVAQAIANGEKNIKAYVPIGKPSTVSSEVDKVGFYAENEMEAHERSVQKKIDEYEDKIESKYIPKGGKQSDASFKQMNEELNDTKTHKAYYELIKERDKMQYHNEKVLYDIANEVLSGNKDISDELKNTLINNYFKINPDNKLVTHLASTKDNYNSLLGKLGNKSLPKLAEEIARERLKEQGKDFDGVFSEMSGWSKRQQQDYLKENAEIAKKIQTDFAEKISSYYSENKPLTSEQEYAEEIAAEERAIYEALNSEAELEIEAFADENYVTKLIEKYETESKGEDKQTPSETESSTGEGTGSKASAEKTKRKTVGTYSSKAKTLADKIRGAELPSWLGVSDPNITANGITADTLKNALADAVELVGQLLDKGVELKKAIGEGLSGLKKVYADNNIPFDEKALTDGFTEFVNNEFAANAPKPNTSKPKNKLTAVEVGVIREVLDKPIDSKEYPTFFDMNAIGKQQTAVTQEAGQDRVALDGTYVTAHLEDLRSISFNNARILQDALGKEWKEKLIGYLEDNPTAGNIAQVSGLLNVINTDIYNEIAKSKNGTEISKLKDLQARADRITYDTGRSASLALNQRRMYQDFGQGKDVVDILSSVILTPEQQATKSKVEEALKQKFADDELNKPKRPRAKKQQQTKQSKPATPKADDSVKKDLISKGQKAAQQTDADGNVTIVSLKDKIQQANDALNGFKC